MSAILFWCRKCDGGFQLVGGEIPPICPGCGQATSYTTSPPMNDPVKPYVITRNDAGFLKRRGIASEEKETTTKS